MLSQNQIKRILSLNQKKYRKKYKLFSAEGVKILNEILFSAYKIDSIFATADWLKEKSAKLFSSGIKNIIEVSEEELKKISNLQTPNKVLAIVEAPDRSIDFDAELILLLDAIRDPGNLGTIIRIADWFGIENIICSPDCVDVFNSKVVQSTMGSICRVTVEYQDLEQLLKLHTSRTVYAATLKGENIHETSFKKPSFVLIGNESEGIHQELLTENIHEIRIPSYGEAESLNASVATGIILDNVKRTGLS
jgi:TrmH family RNA methyltransferase